MTRAAAAAAGHIISRCA